MFTIGAIATAIGIVIALIIPWFPPAASSQAPKVDTLYHVLLIASVPIFVLVETVVLFSVWKFRMRPGDELKDGPPIHGNTRLEVMWTAAPTILIVSLCTYAYTVLHSDEKTKAGEQTVNVIGEQFAWLFSYPQAGGQAIVSPQLYLQKDRPVRFRITSRDVIHEFYVADFRLGLDAVPGITDTLRVTPTRLGNYTVECLELCGNGHSLMRAPVHVVTPAAFQAWFSQQKPQPAPTAGFTPAGAPAPAPAGAPPSTSSTPLSTTPPPTGALSATVAAGKAVFTGPGGCGACHTLAAAGTTGTVGPDLTARLASDCKTPASIKTRGKTLSKCIHTAIVSPYKYIPTGYQPNIMPPTFSQSLSKAQIKSLVAFLVSVTK
jgi:cytochrome c oxidase subunit 2